MGKIHPEIDAALAEFIGKQQMFFVATAPLSADGHVNLSPKGQNTFRIFDPSTVAYLDLTGSGVETISHVRENGRIVILFCSFEGPPKLLRLHGLGEAVEPGDPGFDALRARFGEVPGARAVIVVRLTRIADSCGYSIPLFEYRGDRDQLSKWTEKKGPELVQYQQENNTRGIDGLPGLRRR